MQRLVPSVTRLTAAGLAAVKRRVARAAPLIAAALTVAAALVPCPAAAGEAASDGLDLRVDAARQAGTIRPLHGVNNGPLNRGETVDLRAGYRAMHVPLVRLHDCEWPRPDLVDMHAVFPDPSADPSRPESYRFAKTDAYLSAIIETGAGIVYRLGESIEHSHTKYHVHPPADPGRWAAACIGLIRHTNEGWADGHRWGIRYWEIWNEPENRPAMWTGSDADYYRLYATAARAIKERFPDLRVGGPAVGATGPVADGRLAATDFLEGFLRHVRETGAPLDFFSWHTYTDDPSEYARKTRAIRRWLDERGFPKTEIHLNEWNYLPDGDWSPMLDRERPERRAAWMARIGGPEGAAFLACALIGLQDAPLDAANYYRGDSGDFGLFTWHGVPKKSFHGMRAFALLHETPVRLEATGGQAGAWAACAAAGREGTCVTVLAANLRAAGTTFRLRLDGLPWDGPTAWEALGVDAERNLEPVATGTAEAGPVGLSVPFAAPCVRLVRLRPKGGE